MKKIRVGVIFGGRSGEHEVSIVSARSVIAALDKTKYEAVPVYINKKGQWLLGVELSLIGKEKTEQVYLPADPTAEGLIPFKQTEGLPKKIDVIFPVLHGTFGEDGTIQGLLELAQIPYVGAGVAASGLGMDKALMKKVFEASRLVVPKYLVFLRKEIKENIEKVTSEIEKKIGYPVFTKPANLGSSVGIVKAHDRSELTSGLVFASEYDRKVIVEQGIVKIREIEVAVLGNDDPQASVCGEVVPSKEFYDYEDKYILGKAKLMIPASLPVQISEKIKKMACEAFKAMDCAGMARVDFFFQEKTGKVFIDEINTIPGFTEISMYPKLWEASGVPYSKLLDRLIKLALERYNDKRKSKTHFPSKLSK